MAITTSIRMPDDVYEQYETLAQATGRTRNELMVEALRGMAERQLREIAMIQDRPEDEVKADIQAARLALRDRLAAPSRKGNRQMAGGK